MDNKTDRYHVDILHSGPLYGLGRWSSTLPRATKRRAIREGRLLAWKYYRVHGAYPVVVVVHNQIEETVI